MVAAMEVFVLQNVSKNVWDGQTQQHYNQERWVAADIVLSNAVIGLVGVGNHALTLVWGRK